MEFPDLTFCEDCLNSSACRISAGVLTNVPGERTAQSDTPHTHPAYPSLNSPSYLSLAALSLNPILSITPPFPASVSSAPLQFHRLKNYRGTLGRVVLEGGVHYWEVAVTSEFLWGELFMVGAGVLKPARLEEALSGVRIVNCKNHQTLCFHSYQGTELIGDYPAIVTDVEMEVRVGFLLDLEAGNLLCVDANNDGLHLSTVRNLRPPLVPVFAVSHSKIAPEVHLEIFTGTRINLEEDMLRILAIEAARR